LPLPPRKKSFALIEAEGRKAIALPGHLLEEAFCQKLVADLFVINPGPCRNISHSKYYLECYREGAVQTRRGI
jgi:hypothetical protein